MDNQQEVKVKNIKKHPRLPLLVEDIGNIYLPNGKLLIPVVHRSGYYRVQYTFAKQWCYAQVHRTVAETFLDPPPEWMVEKMFKRTPQESFSFAQRQ